MAIFAGFLGCVERARMREPPAVVVCRCCGCECERECELRDSESCTEDTDVDEEGSRTSVWIKETKLSIEIRV